MNAVAKAPPKDQVVVFQKPRLQWHDAIGERYGDIGVTKATWKALVDAIYPAAETIDSILMALSYCKARNLDPFKRPIHIVPAWDNKKKRFIDTIWPGIAELRTTAVRTGLFAGTDAAVFGPDMTREFVGDVGSGENKKLTKVTLTFPTWAQVTVYRQIEGHRVAIAGPRVYWEETYATMGRSEVPNAMWQRRKRGQLEKCAEAAALRRAFPEELGNEYAAEEMEGRQHYDDAPGATIEGAKPAPVSAAGALDALVSAETEAPEAKETVDPETGEITTEPSDEEIDRLMREEMNTPKEGT